MPEPRHVRHLIVGGGMAGGAALAVLSARVPAGDLLMVGAESDGPYERPMLSKSYLHDGSDELSLRELSARDVGHAQLLGRVAVCLDAETRTVTLDDDSQISCDNLLIATGVENRPLEAGVADRAAVRGLRSTADARELRQVLEQRPDVVIIGGGLIGTEFASECARRKLAVTVVETQAGPLLSIAGDRVSAHLHELYTEAGVDLRTQVGVTRVDDGARKTVALSDGTQLQADLVLVAIGARPAVGWLSSSSIALKNGVLVNEYCETNAPGVFAAGDVAHAWHPHLETRIRIEHESNARIHGAVAARNMLGRRTAHTALPYAWSDQFGHHLWSFGIAGRNDEQLTLAAGSRLITARLDAERRIRSVFGICRADDLERDALVAATRKLVRPPEWNDAGDLESVIGPLMVKPEESL